VGVKYPDLDKYDPFFRWLPISEYILYGWRLQDHRDPKIFFGAVEVTWNMKKRYASEMALPIAETPDEGTYVVMRKPGKAYFSMLCAEPQDALDHVTDACDRLHRLR
jgi:hypothetical protein